MKILSRPQGNAEEYGRWAVNPYKGCSHGCLYCYLKKGVWANGLGGSTVELKTGVVNEEHAYHLAMAEIIEHREEIIRDGGLFMTFTSDPFLGNTLSLFARIARDCAKEGINITILTKEIQVLKYYTYYLREDISITTMNGLEYDYDYSLLSHISFGWTLTGYDELEPNAPSNAKRIEEMATARHYVCSDLLHIWASVEPVIDFDSSYKMIIEALKAGCQHFKIGLLTNNTHVVRKDFKFGEHKFEAYDLVKCVEFIENVMAATYGRATVYWKQSFMDFFGDEPIHGMIARDFLHKWSHSVNKDWNMFDKNHE